MKVCVMDWTHDTCSTWQKDSDQLTLRCVDTCLSTGLSTLSILLSTLLITHIPQMCGHVSPGAGRCDPRGLLAGDSGQGPGAGWGLAGPSGGAENGAQVQWIRPDQGTNQILETSECTRSASKYDMWCVG